MGMYETVRLCAIRVRLAEAMIELEGCVPVRDEIAAVLAGATGPGSNPAVANVLTHAIPDLAYVLAELDSARQRTEDAWQVIEDLEQHRADVDSDSATS